MDTLPGPLSRCGLFFDELSPLIKGVVKQFAKCFWRHGSCIVLHFLAAPYVSFLGMSIIFISGQL